MKLPVANFFRQNFPRNMWAANGMLIMVNMLNILHHTNIYTYEHTPRHINILWNSFHDRKKHISEHRVYYARKSNYIKSP